MKPSILRRIAGALLFIFTVIAALWLLCCTAASFVSPQQAKYLALSSITAPFAIGANICIGLLWLFFARRKWRAIVPLVALIISYRIIVVVFGMHLFTKQDMAFGSNRLKVMSWNVHGMGIFDRPANRTTDDRIIDQIQKEAPDILCLYEFYTVYNNALKPYSTRLMQRCGYREYRFATDNTLGVKIYLGIAIFSKYPIENYEPHILHTRRSWPDIQLLQCDILMPNGKNLRLYATHLQSFLLSDHEKVYLEEVAATDSSIRMDRSRSFVRRFGDAYVKRSIQADSAAAMIARSPYPVVLCGDFNDLPGSYTYERMKGGLHDAFADRGFGLGHTYNMFTRTLRIDYVFFDNAGLSLVGVRSPATKLSDHNPVIANFDIR